MQVFNKEEYQDKKYLTRTPINLSYLSDRCVFKEKYLPKQNSSIIKSEYLVKVLFNLNFIQNITET